MKLWVQSKAVVRCTGTVRHFSIPGIDDSCIPVQHCPMQTWLDFLHSREYRQSSWNWKVRVDVTALVNLRQSQKKWARSLHSGQIWIHIKHPSYTQFVFHMNTTNPNLGTNSVLLSHPSNTQFVFHIHTTNPNLGTTTLLLSHFSSRLIIEQHWTASYNMLTPQLPGCVGPEILIEVPFCGVGDFLLIVYSIASIVAFLWRNTQQLLWSSRKRERDIYVTLHGEGVSCHGHYHHATPQSKNDETISYKNRGRLPTWFFCHWRMLSDNRIPRLSHTLYLMWMFDAAVRICLYGLWL